MKTMGLIGGMSWESTATYYSLVNRGVNAALGGNHSSACVLYSVDFQDIETLQYSGDWDALRGRMLDAGEALKRAGADFAVLCTNTMHKVVDGFEAETGLPLVHIADAVGEAVAEKGVRTVGLLGTIFTMEQDFYKEKLRRDYGLTVLVPEESDRKIVNGIIYGELVKGVVKDASRAEYLRVMDSLRSRGAEGMILGCTEIGLLVRDYSLPLFDSTPIHAAKAVRTSLA